MVGLAALLFPGVVSAEVIFSDTFEGSDIRHAGTVPNFWTVTQSPDSSKSGASKEKGRLLLLAANRPYAYVSLASPKMEKFGFFSHPLTITLDEIQLEAKGIPEGEARFKVSVASAQTTAEQAEDVISLRIRSGLLLMGYRIDGFNLSSPPETLAGEHVNSVAVIPLKGVPKKVSLTLGPSPRDGFVKYEIIVLDDGIPVSRSGSIPLTIVQWGGNDEASLIIDARRDSDSSLPGTQTEFSLGQITVAR